MKIKSKLTGEVSNVRGDIAKEMVKLGVAEFVPLDKSVSLLDVARANLNESMPPTPAIPKFEVRVRDLPISGKKELVIQCTVAKQEIYYSGKPENANLRREWEGGGRFLNGFGRAVPDDICALYGREWKKCPTLRGYTTKTAEEQNREYKEFMKRQDAEREARYRDAGVGAPEGARI